MTLPFPADRLRPVPKLSIALKLASLALAAAILAPCAPAQDRPPESKPAETPRPAEVQETIYLHNATAQRDLNDVQTALRNMLPRAGMYGVYTQDAIVIRATPQDLETAKRLIAELDRPRKTWRVTYTLTDTGNGSPSGAKHVALIVVSGSDTTLKQGSKVPLITSLDQSAPATQNTQVQYIDVGLNISASIDGEHLHSKVEQSGITDEKSGLGAQDPVVHQTTLDSESNLDPGKTVVLGSIDVPGSTQHREIAVTVEPLS